MKKIKEHLLELLIILLQYIPLLGIIVASAYITRASQINSYEVNTLLLWIIEILGFLAASIVIDKYLRISKIEKGVEQLLSQSAGTSGSIDDYFLTRKESKPLEEKIRLAKTITITGGSLSRLSDEYYGVFEDKLKENCTIQLIMVRPYSSAANLLCDNVVYETEDHDTYSLKVKESLDRFSRLKKEYPSNLSIRLTDNVPPFSLIIINEKLKDAIINVELYSYSVHTRDRIQFKITKKDHRSFEFFISQLRVLREKSTEYADGK